MEPKDIHLTPVENSEAAALVELARSTYYETFVSMGYYNHDIVTGYLDASFSYEKISRDLRSPDCHYFFVGTRASPRAGYCKLVNESDLPPLLGTSSPPSLRFPLYLERIYLKREAQGQGLGRATLLACERVATQLGAEWVWLTVWEYNTQAIAFYERTGFSRIGATQFSFESQGEHYTDTDHVYVKRLDG